MVILAVILFIISLLLLILAKYYGDLQANEISRKSRNDHKYKPLLIIVRNKNTTIILLRFLTVVIYGLALTLLVFDRSRWFVFISVVVSVLLIIFISNFYGRAGLLADILAPKLSVVVLKLRFLNNLSDILGKYFMYYPDDRIYDERDLMLELKNQAHRDYNRIPETKLALMASVLNFTELTATDLMRPKKEVVFIDSEETISTVLMDELHKSDQKYFPVYKDKKSQVVGVLSLNDLIEKRMSGKVSWAMSENIYEINHDELLKVVLDQYIASKNGLFIVREDKKIVGILLIDDLLNRLLV